MHAHARSHSTHIHSQAIALLTGRLLVLLGGHEKLAQACLPLLMDAVTMAPPPLTGNGGAAADVVDLQLFACFTRTIAGEPALRAWLPACCCLPVHLLAACCLPASRTPLPAGMLGMHVPAPGLAWGGCGRGIGLSV